MFFTLKKSGSTPLSNKIQNDTMQMQYNDNDTMYYCSILISLFSLGVKLV